jgi:hypothetical protein
MSRRIRIVALADSLALPRDENGTRVLWDDTWPYRLGEELRDLHLEAEVINHGARSMTAPDLIRPHPFTNHVVLTRPQVIVVQVGIVDCAPRIFSRRANRILSRVPDPLRRLVIDHRSKKRRELIARNPLRRVYTAPDDYRRAMEALKTKLAGLDFPVHVLVLPVLSHPRLDERSPGYSGNVRRYNAILSSVWESFIPPDELGISDDFFAEDGYHLSRRGNEAVARTLAERIASRS